MFSSMYNPISILFICLVGQALLNASSLYIPTSFHIRICDSFVSAHNILHYLCATKLEFCLFLFVILCPTVQSFSIKELQLRGYKMLKIVKDILCLKKAVGILSVILYLNFGSTEAMSLNICLCPSLSAQRVGSYTGMSGPLCIQGFNAGFTLVEFRTIIGQHFCVIDKASFICFY